MSTSYHSLRGPDTLCGRLRAMHAAGEIDLAATFPNERRRELAKRLGCPVTTLHGVIGAVRRQLGIRVPRQKGLARRLAEETP